MKITAIILCLGLLVGCAGTSVQTQDAIISTVAVDVGYGVYRAVPDARPILSTVCLIKDFTKPDLVALQLKEALGKIWEDANQITSTDAQIAVLTLNNLMGLLSAQLDNANVQRAGAIIQVVITNLCKGVALAEPKTAALCVNGVCPLPK